MLLSFLSDWRRKLNFHLLIKAMLFQLNFMILFFFLNKFDINIHQNLIRNFKLKDCTHPLFVKNLLPINSIEIYSKILNLPRKNEECIKILTSLIKTI